MFEILLLLLLAGVPPSYLVRLDVEWWVGGGGGEVPAATVEGGGAAGRRRCRELDRYRRGWNGDIREHGCGRAN